MFSVNDEYKQTDDFYNYINSNWINEKPIPDDLQRWSSFNELDELTKDRMKKLLNGIDNTEGKYNKLKRLYDAGNSNFESDNKDNLMKYINDIKSCSTIDELMNLVFKLFIKKGLSSPILYCAYNDFNNSENVILHLFTGGLTLPDRDYYFEDDKEEIREGMMNMIRELFNYCGIKCEDCDIDNIMLFEKLLADKTYTRVEKRDPHKINNVQTYELMSKYGYLNLDKLFDWLRVDEERNERKINVSNIDFLMEYMRLLRIYKLEDIKNYFVLRFILSTSNYINEDIYDITFNFYGKMLSGIKEKRELWKRIYENTNNLLGNVMGNLYVDNYFNKNSKDKVLKMIEYIKLELEHRLRNNDWMKDVTKDKALEKLEKMNAKIGYPETFRDYNRLNFDNDNNYLEMCLLCMEENEIYDYDRLYDKKDVNRWSMEPHNINAYYSPSFNEIVFPAGILQEPFFSDGYDMSLNFGGIGCVIGHEITHGFDDQGSQYDGDGNLNNWWLEEDKNNYNNKIEMIRRQYACYKIEDEFLNGDLTLGENIADLGGVSISYHAYLRYLKDEGVEEDRCDFFRNYARIWRCNTRSEEIKKRIKMDPHSPPIYRVNGVLENMNEFYELFNVREGCGLYKDESLRASVW